jgi:hypothetical protein
MRVAGQLLNGQAPKQGNFTRGIFRFLWISHADERRSEEENGRDAEIRTRDPLTPSQYSQHFYQFHQTPLSGMNGVFVDILGLFLCSFGFSSFQPITR